MSVKQQARQTTVSLPEPMIEEIKARADRLGLPWTTAIRVLLREALDYERVKASEKPDDKQ
jgi:predicted DNA binding CopG/RHH family protein